MKTIGTVGHGALGALMAAWLGTGFALADTRNWRGATTGEWAVAGNWEENAVPADGDDVVITNAGAVAILSGSSENLNSLTLSRTLVFTNWTAALRAATVTILSNGVMTLPPAFASTNDTMSNRVYVVCSNLTIAAGGRIDVDGKGYDIANGFGTPAGGRAGAGHGGLGGRSSYTYGGVVYGSAEAPLDPGSGGDAATGGRGGGAVRIQAPGGTVTVNGVITANGTDGTSLCGGGSGGSVFITCGTLAGSNGVISANGGGQVNYGSGGGGRIAVIYDIAAQAGKPVPGVVFSVAPGSSKIMGDLGTLYFPNSAFLTETIPHSGRWLAPGGTNWSAASLLISNAWFRFPFDGSVITITNDMKISDGGRLDLGGNAVTNLANYVQRWFSPSTPVTLNIGGGLTLTNLASLYVYGAPSNAPPSDYGALVNVAGDLCLSANSWIYPVSHPANGGSPLFIAQNLTILTNAGFNADELGFITLTGPGAPHPSSRAGPGYGGKGSDYGTYSGGDVYGSSNAPVDAGSGGSGTGGGYGGGSVRIQVAKRITVNGTITANGQKGNSWTAGSGGGVYLECHTFAGNNGAIYANGGSTTASYGGSGGGRIAIWRVKDESAGGVSVSATNGAVKTVGVYEGQPGTVVWGDLAVPPAPGTVIIIR